MTYTYTITVDCGSPATYSFDEPQTAEQVHAHHFENVNEESEHLVRNVYTVSTADEFTAEA